MKRMLLLLAFSAAAFAQDGFQPLFNGKNLDGWDGDPRMWSVRDGMIVGRTEGVTMSDNSFLLSKQPYRNFILRAEMKLRNHNSGVQFRSEALANWVVRGYQADAAQDNYWGNIYDEKGRGTLVDGWEGKAAGLERLRDSLRRRSHQADAQRPGDCRPARFGAPGRHYRVPVASRSAHGSLLPQCADQDSAVRTPGHLATGDLRRHLRSHPRCPSGGGARSRRALSTRSRLAGARREAAAQAGRHARAVCGPPPYGRTGLPRRAEAGGLAPGAGNRQQLFDRHHRDGARA